MKRLFAILISIFIFQFILTSHVYANLDDSIFIIKVVYPASGQTNVPVDLKCSLSGCAYNGTVGVISVGYGTDLSGGCGNPPNCPNIPDIKTSSVNPSTITISSPNDPNIFIVQSGTQECFGQCFGSDNFYHSFQFYPANSAFPYGIHLMPNTTYTITVKGGSSGIVAVRSTVNGNKNVYLPNDYSWSFTTGNGEVPARQAPTPTLTPIPTPTPISIPSPSSQNSTPNPNVTTTTTTSVITPTPAPTIKTTTQKTTKQTTKVSGTQSSPSNSPSAKPTSSSQPVQKQIQKNTPNILERIRNFFSVILGKLFHR